MTCSRFQYYIIFSKYLIYLYIFKYLKFIFFCYNLCFFFSLWACNPNLNDLHNPTEDQLCRDRGERRVKQPYGGPKCLSRSEIEPVTLSKTKKKGREHKEAVVKAIEDAIEKYNFVYVFSFENMRNQRFKEFREQLKSTSRFFLGSNKVMQISLGRSTADEVRPGLHKVSKLLRGDARMYFTNLPKEEVERLFNEFEEYDYARTASIASEKVNLKEGPLEQFTHEMEPFHRKQGMPVRLNKGVVELVSDYVVCEEGKPFVSRGSSDTAFAGDQGGPIPTSLDLQMESG